MGMTACQQQQHSTPQQAVLANSCSQRYSIQDTADSKLIAQAPGIAASCSEPDDNEFGHVMRIKSHQP